MGQYDSHYHSHSSVSTDAQGEDMHEKKDLNEYIKSWRFVTIQKLKSQDKKRKLNGVRILRKCLMMTGMSVGYIKKVKVSDGFMQ